jgi:hypothetical protein
MGGGKGDVLAKLVALGKRGEVLGHGEVGEAHHVLGRVDRGRPVHAAVALVFPKHPVAFDHIVIIVISTSSLAIVCRS